MLRAPVFLTGFMATGKSKLGRLLARLMNCRFVDTDDLIQDRAGRTISEIFEVDGEEHFRRLEYESVVEVARQKDLVVALGGGAVTQERVRDAIRDAGGILVCIAADVDTILERVSRKETRPMLAGLDLSQKRQKIVSMLAERAPYYALADVTFRSAAELAPEDSAQQLLDLLARQQYRCEPSN